MNNSVSPDHGRIDPVAAVGPGDQAGVRAGDIIEYIDGKATRDISLYDARQLLNGQSGTEVKLRILRANARQPLTLNVKRGSFRAPLQQVGKPQDDDAGAVADPVRRGDQEIPAQDRGDEARPPFCRLLAVNGPGVTGAVQEADRAGARRADREVVAVQIDSGAEARGPDRQSLLRAPAVSRSREQEDSVGLRIADGLALGRLSRSAHGVLG